MVPDSPLLSWPDVLALVGLLYTAVLVQAIVISAIEARKRQRRQRAYGARLRWQQRGRGR